jgi:hypothetical protein
MIYLFYKIYLFYMKQFLYETNLHEILTKNLKIINKIIFCLRQLRPCTLLRPGPGLRRRCPDKPLPLISFAYLMQQISLEKGLLISLFRHFSFACRVCYLFTIITGFRRDSRFSGRIQWPYPVVSIQWSVSSGRRVVSSEQSAVESGR